MDYRFEISKPIVMIFGVKLLLMVNRLFNNFMIRL